MTWLRRLLSGSVLIALIFSMLSAQGLASVQANSFGSPNELGTETIIINEVAWGGTQANSDHEWIELYNPTSNPIVINGWTLKSGDNNPTISLSGTISPGGYFLLERYQDAVDNITADLVYASSQTLTNSGEALSLYDNSPIPVLIDTANGDGSSWPAGSGSPDYCSMERRGPIVDIDLNWIKSTVQLIGIDDSGNNICGSPRAQNIQFITPTPTIPPTATPEWERLILINEVAWGGTQADDTLAQWIELYNPSLTDPVTVTGWYLQIPGKGNIPLSGTIGPGGYYLIERNQTDTSVVGNLVYAFPFLDVTGDSLYLYSNTNNLVDSANSNGGPWPAGNRFASYQSMERHSNEPDTDAAWLTFAGTPLEFDRLNNLINGSPGRANLPPGSTSTPTFTPTATFTPTLTFTPSPTLTPTQTSTPSVLRSVLINEIAWMGTLAANGSDDEWIELYNPGSSAIDISGWKITLDDVLFITIENGKTIGAGQYFLLERGADATSVTENQVFSGAISNDGKKMKLLTASNQLIDSANSYGGGWPSGNNTTKCSMERRGTTIQDSDTAWITNTGTPKIAQDADNNWICGTPGYRNWAYDVTPTPSPVNSAAPSRTPTKTRTPTPIPAAKISQVIINEFLSHPRSDWNNDGLVDSGDEFIELMNVGNASINLQGWRLDDQEGDSSPYTLGSVDLAPGARLVFFASQTGLLLSNRSDSVRVLKTNGSISDAYTYTTVPVPDQSWCRLPDGKPTWVFGCQPTLAQTNQLAETVYRAEVDLPAVCESPNLPTSIYLAECLPSGLDAWSRRLWDGFLPVFQVLYERHGQQYWIE